MNSEIRICNNCVMDTTDPNIHFNDEGVCDHCENFLSNIVPELKSLSSTEDALDKMIFDIKHRGRKYKYDCILGLSGGLDSSYMLHLLSTKYKLRMLVFHVDCGWNSERAVSNIRKMVDALGINLFTKVVDWEEMRDLQLSFFKAGVSHLDTPQDHAYTATMYHYAKEYNVKSIINGGNFSTEGVRNPLDWLYHGSDVRNVLDIYRQNSVRKLDKFPLSDIFFHKLFLRYFRGIKVKKPLNLINYNKIDAIAELADKYDWMPYDEKHYESRFTKFFEGYWLPTRFGYDTRKVQYSSLILSGQLTRSDALKKLSRLSLSDNEIVLELQFIADKLQIDVDKLKKYLEMPKYSYSNYKNRAAIFSLGSKIMKTLGMEKSVKR